MTEEAAQPHRKKLENALIKHGRSMTYIAATAPMDSLNDMNATE